MDLRDIVEAAEDQGFRVELSKKGHVIFYSPDKSVSPVVAAGTTSDVRSIRNLLARLRGAGLVYPVKRGKKKWANGW
jgi:hypothetical protein